MTEYVHGRRVRRDQGARPGDARPRRRDRLPLLLRLHVPPPPVLRRPASRATSCCMPDGRVAFLDFGLFKVMPARADRDRARPASAPATRATPSGCSEILSRDRLPARARPLPARQAARPVPRRDVVVRDSTRRSQLEPEIATAGDDRHVATRARRTSGRCATRRCPPTTCSAAASSCSRSPCSSQLRARAQLAPDRARVDVRRPARDRAGPRGDRLLRLLDLQQARRARACRTAGRR